MKKSAVILGVLSLILVLAGCPTPNSNTNGDPVTITSGSLKIPSKLTFEFGEEIPSLNTWEVTLNYSNRTSVDFKYSDHVNDLTLNPTAEKIEAFINGTGGRSLQISVTYNKSENFVPITGTLTVNGPSHSWQAEASASFVATWDDPARQGFTCDASKCEVNPGVCEVVKLVNVVGSVALKSNFSKYHVDLTANDPKITNTNLLGFGGSNPGNLIWSEKADYNSDPDPVPFATDAVPMRTVREGLDRRWSNAIIKDKKRGAVFLDLMTVGDYAASGGLKHYHISGKYSISVDKNGDFDYTLMYGSASTIIHDIRLNFTLVALGKVEEGKDAKNAYAIEYFDELFEPSPPVGSVEATFSGYPAVDITLSQVIKNATGVEEPYITAMLNQGFDWYLVVKNVIDGSNYSHSFSSKYWVFRNVVKITDDDFWDMRNP